MPAILDHLILKVRDADASASFYARILGFSTEGKDGPFTVVRVSEHLTLQLAPWGTQGGEHLAFALTRDEFDTVFARIKAANMKYGGSFHDVGKQSGPGDEMGAHGMGQALYFFDPDQHLIEIRHYER